MTSLLTNTIQEIENLESFYLIWLSNSINTDVQQQLRAIINYLLTFEDSQQCLQYIHSLSNDSHIVLIVNEKLAQQFIPQIVHLQQITSIYIYANDKKSNDHWVKNFKKVNHSNLFVNTFSGVKIRDSSLIIFRSCTFQYRRIHLFATRS